MTKWSLILIILRLIANVNSATCCDPCWPLPGGNPALSCEAPSKCGPEQDQLTLLWHTKTILLSSSVVAADNKLFVSGAKEILCIIPANGEIIWTRGYKLIKTPLAYYDYKLYFATNDGYFNCIDANDALTKWVKYLEDLPRWFGPNVTDGLVYVPSWNTVACYNASSGELVWSLSTDGIVDSGCSLDGNYCFFKTENSFYLVNSKTGKMFWQQNYPGRVMGINPIINSNRIYVSADKLYCLDLRTGDEIWSKPHPYEAETLCFANNRLYASGDWCSIVCYDFKKGEKLWEKPLQTAVFTLPIYCNNKIYGITWGGDEGIKTYLRVFNADDGSVISSIKTSQGCTSLAIAYKRVYLTAFDGVYCYGNK